MALARRDARPLHDASRDVGSAFRRLAGIRVGRASHRRGIPRLRRNPPLRPILSGALLILARGFWTSIPPPDSTQDHGVDQHDRAADERAQRCDGDEAIRHRPNITTCRTDAFVAYAGNPSL